MESVEVKSYLKNFEWAIGYYHFPIDKRTTDLLSSEGHKRVVCWVNDKVKMHCALMPLGEGSFIMVNKKIRKELGIHDGDQVSLRLEKETAPFGMPMPETFEMVFSQDEQAFQYFKALTPGKQRSLIYIVSKLKNIDKQINKSLAIAEHLIDVKGKLDYKLLNQKIKDFNQNKGY